MCRGRISYRRNDKTYCAGSRNDLTRNDLNDLTLVWLQQFKKSDYISRKFSITLLAAGHQARCESGSELLQVTYMYQSFLVLTGKDLIFFYVSTNVNMKRGSIETVLVVTFQGHGTIELKESTPYELEDRSMATIRSFNEGEDHTHVIRPNVAAKAKRRKPIVLHYRTRNMRVIANSSGCHAPTPNIGSISVRSIDNPVLCIMEATIDM